MRNLATQISRMALALIFVFGFGGVYAALNGTYSINSGAAASATNYVSIGAAISDMMTGVRTDGGTPNGPGVSGPVILRLAAGSGPYNEQLTIGAIAGASVTNTIRITGGPGMGTVQFTGTTTADRQVFKLNGAKHVILDSLTIINNDAVYGYGVHITNNADSNRVSNCAISVINTSTSGNFAGVCISGATPTTAGNNGDGNVIANNTISGGYYGIAINGTSTTVYGTQNNVINNRIQDYYYYGIRHYYQVDGEISGNDLTPRATASTSNYGLYIYYNDRFNINRNIVRSAGIYGIYVFYGNHQGGTGTARAKISNNMITGAFSSTTPSGIYFSTNCSNIDLVHNSISMTTGNGRCVYWSSGTGNTVQNNIFSYENSTTGYGFYAVAANFATTCDYNDFWVPGSANFLYYAAAFSTATYQGGAGFNTNSLNSNPSFVNSASDLHIGSGVALYDAGTFVGITEDFDGQTRPLAPSVGYDIGADEFTPALNDAGVVAMPSPALPFGAGVQNVDFSIRNFGVSTLSSATINWQVNGVTQTPFPWIGTLASASNSAPVTVGTYNFIAGTSYNIKAWTTNPNGSSDANSINDTLELNVCVGLSGTYSVGGVGADFPSLTSAVNALICGGVAGPVTFNLTQGAGPFNEQLIIPSIAGASSTNTIRFNGGANRETVQYLGTNINQRGVFILNGASNIILDSLTIINNDPTYAYGVHMTFGADDNVVSNSLIIVDTTSTSANFAGISISGQTPTTLADNGDGNQILNNEIVGGYYGVSINGTSSTVYSQNNSVIGNRIRDFYYYGIRFYAQNGGNLSENNISSRSTGSVSAYGMYLYYADNFTVSKNYINNVGIYGIYSFYGNYQGGTGTTRAKIVNNMIGGVFRTSGTPYGIYLSTNASNIDIWHNSISIAGAGRGFYCTTGGGLDLRNNSFAVYGGGASYAMYIATTTTIAAMDYNNYHCPNSSNFFYFGANYAAGTYQGIGGFNLNAREGDPFYIDPANNLHAFATQLFDGGDATLTVTEDIDGELRPNAFSTIPDIGADEFLPDSVNITTSLLLDPGNNICPDSNQVVRAVIFNKGLNTISNIAMTAEVSGFVTTTLTATAVGPLAFGDRDTVVLGTINTWAGGNLNFKVYNTVPNDQDLVDDTLNATRSINFTPVAPTAASATICENDSTELVAVGTGTKFWFDAMNGGNQIGSGDTVMVAPGATTTYYVESRGVAPNSITTTFAGGNGCSGGNMFDIIAINEITIDSLDLNLNGSAASWVYLYYKVGTHSGFETTPGAWTLYDSALVNAAGAGLPTRCPIGGLTVPAGQTYGIYVFNPNVAYTTLSSTTTYSNSDLDLVSGIGLCSLFGGTNNPRGWNGTVYYTAEGCASQRTPVTVTVNALPVLSLMDTTACGSYTLDAGNAGLGYSYNWSTGDTTQMVTVAASGTYTVTVSNGSCDVMDTAIVAINPAPSVNLGSDQELCNGASATLDAGNPGSTYLWSTSATTQTITVSAAGTYYVDVTGTNGCVSTDTIVITTLTSAVPAMSIDTSACPDIVFTGSNTGGAATSIDWDFGDSQTGTGASATNTYASNGTYTVTLTMTNGCGASTSTSTITISCLVGIEDGVAGGVELYPNPTRNAAELKVNLPSAGDATIEVLNIEGQQVWSKVVNATAGLNSFQIQVGDLSAGVYFVKIKTDDFNWQGKLVKE